MSSTIQWCGDAEAEGEPALQDGLGGERLLHERHRVAGLDGHDGGADLDRGWCAGPCTVAAVRASNSSGIWGVQMLARPAASAHSASVGHAARPWWRSGPARGRSSGRCACRSPRPRRRERAFSG